MSELAFDYSKRVLDLGAHAGFELFDLLGCSMYRVVLVQRSALAPCSSALAWVTS